MKLLETAAYGAVIVASTLVALAAIDGWRMLYRAHRRGHEPECRDRED